MKPAPSPLTRALTLAIRGYQRSWSVVFPPSCRYWPSCMVPPGEGGWPSNASAAAIPGVAMVSILFPVQSPPCVWHRPVLPLPPGKRLVRLPLTRQPDVLQDFRKASLAFPMTSRFIRPAHRTT